MRASRRKLDTSRVRVLVGVLMDMPPKPVSIDGRIFAAAIADLGRCYSPFVTCA